MKKKKQKHRELLSKIKTQLCIFIFYLHLNHYLINVHAATHKLYKPERSHKPMANSIFNKKKHSDRVQLARDGRKFHFVQKISYQFRTIRMQDISAATGMNALTFTIVHSIHIKCRFFLLLFHCKFNQQFSIYYYYYSETKQMNI